MATTTRTLTYQGDMLVGDSFDEVSMSDGAYSWQFDGTTQSVYIPHNTVLNFAAVDWTIEFWALPTTTDNLNRAVYFKRASASILASVYIEYNGSTKFWNIGVANATGSAWTVNSTTDVAADVGVWQHIAIVRSGVNIYAYKNGVRISLSSGMSTSIIYDDGSAATIASEGVIPVSGATSYGAYRFRGLLSNFCITKGVARYTAAVVTPPTSPLVSQGSVTSLLTCQSTTFKDNSSYVHAIYDVNAPVISYKNPFTPSEKSIYFNNNINTYMYPSGTPVPTTGPFTLELWLYTIASATQTIYSCYDSSANYWNFSIDNNSGYKLLFYNFVGSISIWGTTVIPLNQWNHVALVRDSSNNLMIFLNGSLEVTSYFTATISNSAARIGVFPTSLYPFQGYMSNLRFDSVTAIYTANSITRPNANLTTISGTSLLTAQSATIVDAAGNTITNPNSVTSTTSTIPYTGAYSYSFNGTNQYLSVPNTAGLGSYASDFAVEAWIYPTSLTGGPFTVVGQYKLANGRAWIMYVDSTGTFIVQVNGSTVLTSASAVITISNWYHILWIRKGTSQYLYINGLLISSATSVTPTGTDPIFIGASNDAASPTSFFAGYISNLRIVKGNSVYTPIANYDYPIKPLDPLGTTYALAGKGLFITKDASINNLALSPTNTISVSDLNPFESSILTNETSISYAQRLTNSVSFNGSTQYITVPANSGFAFGTGDFTVECWVYITTTLIGGAFVGSWTGTASTSAWLFTQGNSAASNLRFGVSDGSATTFFEGTGGLSTNQWIHIAAVRTSGTIKLYSNGIQVYSGAAAQNISVSSQTLQINGVAGATYLTTGYMSNIRVVKGAAIYSGASTSAANFTVPLVPLARTQSSSTNISAITDTTQVVLLTCQKYGEFSDTSIYNSTISTLPTALTTTSRDLLTTSTKSPFGTYQTPALTNNYYSILFNGSSQYINAPANAGFAFGTGDFTIEAWVNFNAFSVITPIAQNDAVGTSTSDKWYFGYTASTLTFANHGALSVKITIPWTPSTSTWYHVAVVRSNGTLLAFINGTQGISTITGTPSTYSFGQNGITIGAMSTPYYLNGYISNFRIIKGIAIYASSFTPSTSPLTAVAGTQLLTCQSSVIQDNTTTPFSITNTGDNISALNTFRSLAPYSYQFNGTTQYLTVPASSTFAFGTTGDFTIETWVYLNSTSLGQIIDGSPNGGGSAPLSPIINTNGGVFNLYSSGAYQISGTTTIVIGRWYHVAVVRISGSTKLYVNGAQEGVTYPDSSLYSSSGSLFIGRNASASNSFLNGFIASLRIVKGIGVYTGAFTPPTTPLTSTQSSGTNISAITGTSTSLLTCQDIQIVDNSLNNFTITNAGSVVSSKSIVPFNTISYNQPEFPISRETPGGSLLTNNYLDDFSIGGSKYGVQLNGTSQYVTIPGNSTAFALPGDFTIEGWFFFPIVPGTSTGAYAVMDCGSANQIGFYLQTTSLSVFLTTGAILATFTYTWSANVWTHIAIVRSGTTLNCYVNGTALTPVTGISNSFLSPNTLNIGRNPGSIQYLKGTISNFRIVKGTAVYTSNFSTDNLYPLKAISGTTLLTFQNSSIVDNSTTPLTITNVGSATTNTIPSLLYSTIFNGSSSYLNIPTSSFLPVINNTYTIEMWIYPLANPSGSYELYQLSNTNTSSFGDFSIQMNSAGRIVLNVRPSTGGSIVTITTAASVLLTNWTHIAVSVNSGAAILYINGINSGTATVVAMDGTQSWCSTGYLNNGYTTGISFYNGHISNLRIVRGKALYPNNFVPSKEQLTAITGTSLLTCQSSSVTVDNSGNSLAITTSATAPTSSTPIVSKTVRKQYSTGINEVAGKLDDYTKKIVSASTYFNGKYQYLAWNPVDANIGTISGGLTSGIAFGNSDFTVELWFNSASPLTNQTLIDTKYILTNSWTLGFGLPGYPNGTLVWQGNGGGVILAIPYVFTTNTWYHIALVKISGTNYMYVNGVLQGSNATAYNINQIYTQAKIGSRYIPTSTANTPFKGYINNIRIVKNIGVYTGAFTPPTSNLGITQSSGTNIAALTDQRNTVLLTCQDSSITDASQYNFSIYGSYDITTSSIVKPF